MNPSIHTLAPLAKRFGRRTVLEKIELHLEPGQALGLLGPNGAGKTTLLRMLAGIYSPDAGKVEVLGRLSTALRPQERQLMGYVSENQDIPGWMTVQVLINYLKPLYPAWDDAFAARLIKLFELPLHQKIKTFSRGMKMKTAFLSSLAYRPRLLLLDEPFSGLDPVVLSDLLDALVEITQQAEWTMLLSSHDMDHVERLVDEVAILRSPQIILRETISSLQDRFRRVDFLTEATTPTKLSLPAGWQRFNHQGRSISLVDSSYDAARFTTDLASLFPDARELAVHAMSLKEIYIALLRPQTTEITTAAAA
jgi:ABC-2 type transport system ATP-binding protein